MQIILCHDNNQARYKVLDSGKEYTKIELQLLQCRDHLMANLIYNLDCQEEEEEVVSFRVDGEARTKS